MQVNKQPKCNKNEAGKSCLISIQASYFQGMHYALFSIPLQLEWLQLQTSASSKQPVNETLTKCLRGTFITIGRHVQNIELANCGLQKTLNLVLLKEYTFIGTQKEQDALTQLFLCNNIDTVYSIRGKNLKSFNREIISHSLIFYGFQEIF